MTERVGLRERWEAKVDKSAGPDACWPWTANRYKCGYGQMRVGKGPTGAHRVAFFLANGHWPQVARHSCDNKICVNPAHILDGTASDNQLDCVLRNRHWQTRKTHCKHGHEFTPENTRSVRTPGGWTGRACRTCDRDAQRSKWRVKHGYHPDPYGPPRKLGTNRQEGF